MAVSDPSLSTNACVAVLASEMPVDKTLSLVASVTVAPRSHDEIVDRAGIDDRIDDDGDRPLGRRRLIAVELLGNGTNRHARIGIFRRRSWHCRQLSVGIAAALMLQAPPPM